MEEFFHSNFDVGAKSKLPKGLELEVPRKAGDTYLRSAEKLWTNYWPDKTLLRELEDSLTSGKVPPSTIDKLKLARARLKVVRFLCEAICADHSSPAHLDQITKVIGKLEEIQKFSGDPAKTKNILLAVLDAFSEKSMRKLNVELAGMQAAGRRSNEKWIHEARKIIAKSLDRKLDEREFHDVRKTIGRLQTMALFDGLSNNDQKKLEAYSWLRKLYNKLGDEHDKMVKLEFENADMEDVRLSEKMVGNLKDLLKATR